jgi:APA family basic amino acid/polyamine antiporter
MFRRKEFDELRAEFPGEGALRRALGPVALTTLGVGAMLGSGIFVLPGYAAAAGAGNAVSLSVVVTGVAFMFAGLCYAEMAAMVPVAGSSYNYAYATLGEFVAWVVGWAFIVTTTLGAAMAASSFSAYALSVLGDFGVHLPAGSARWLAPGVVVAIASTLILGIQESARSNTLFVVLNLASILVFLALGLSALPTSRSGGPFLPQGVGEDVLSGWYGVLRGAGCMAFAFLGFEAVASSAEEARNPQRDVPIAMLASISSGTILFVLVAYVLTRMVNYHALDVADPIAIALNVSSPIVLRIFVKLGAMSGLASSLLVLTLSQTRMLFAMTRDGLLPRALASVHPRFRTPLRATIATGSAVTLAAFSLPAGFTGLVASMGLLYTNAIVCLGTLVLRWQAPEMPRPFRVPGVYLVAPCGIAASISLLAAMPYRPTLTFVSVMFFGLVYYSLVANPRARATAAPITSRRSARQASDHELARRIVAFFDDLVVRMRHDPTVYEVIAAAAAVAFICAVLYSTTQEIYILYAHLGVMALTSVIVWIQGVR